MGSQYHHIICVCGEEVSAGTAEVSEARGLASPRCQACLTIIGEVSLPPAQPAHCIHCSNEATDGIYCADCRERNRVACQRRRERLREQGMCIFCGQRPPARLTAPLCAESGAGSQRRPTPATDRQRDDAGGRASFINLHEGSKEGSAASLAHDEARRVVSTTNSLKGQISNEHHEEANNAQAQREQEDRREPCLTTHGSGTPARRIYA